jgi:Domain of unknown function (DUF4157)
MEACAAMFPTIDFSRITLFEGPPFLLRPITRNAITVTSGVRATHIYLRKGTYDPCSLEGFVLVAHELVHALQIEKGPASRAYLNSWAFRYLRCLITSLTFAGGGGNGLENEAYEYGTLVRAYGALPCRRTLDGSSIDTDPAFGPLPEQLVKATVEPDRCEAWSRRPVIDRVWRAVATGLAFLGALVYTLVDRGSSTSSEA